MRNGFLTAALVASVLAFASPAALAAGAAGPYPEAGSREPLQSWTWRPDRGPPPSAYHNGSRFGTYDDEIGPREARRIAREAGMADTQDVRRRGPVWIVHGEDRGGHDLHVTINARSGAVVHIDPQI